MMIVVRLKMVGQSLEITWGGWSHSVLRTGFLTVRGQSLEIPWGDWSFQTTGNKVTIDKETKEPDLLPGQLQYEPCIYDQIVIKLIC